jgi:hypothetical protein
MDRWAWGQLEPVAADPTRTSDRSAALRDPRPDRRTALGSLGRAKATTPRGRRGWRPTTIRTTSAAACARRRDGARTRPPRCHPAPTARPSRHHQRLPPGIDSAEIIDTVHGRPSPTTSASAGLKITVAELSVWVGRQSADPGARSNLTLGWRRAGVSRRVDRDPHSWPRGHRRRPRIRGRVCPVGEALVARIGADIVAPTAPGAAVSPASRRGCYGRNGEA